MGKKFEYLIDKWIGILIRFAWPIVIVALLLTALSVYYSVTHLGFKTRRSDLVASSQSLIAMKNRLEREFGSRDGLVVVVENQDRQRSIAFAKTLATELRQYPSEFPELFYRVNPDQLRPWALLYLEPKDLLQLKDKLVRHRQVMTEVAADPSLSRFFQAINQEVTRSMIGALFTDFLEEEGEEQLPDLSLLNATLRQFNHHLEGQQPYTSPLKAFFPKGLGDWQEEGYFFTENDKYLLLLITTPGGGCSVSRRCLISLRKAVDRVKAHFPGIKVGVTGPEALEDDEMTESMRDITLATWLSLVGQLLLLIMFFRSLKRPLVEGLALVMGLCWTLGLTTLVIGHLNILSIIFAPLMMGITIDYGIHWFCHLEEEANGTRRCTFKALINTEKYGTPGIIYAALATTVSFLPLIFTGFKGLAELGLILFMGIPTMLAVTLLVQPALVLILEHCPLRDPTQEVPRPPRPFLPLRWQRPGLILTVGLLIFALGGISVWHVPFDLNPLNLQNQETESVVWELKLLEGARYSSVYGVMATSSLAETQARIEALKKLPTVSHVESILSFMPSDPESKLRLLQDLKPVISQVKFFAQGSDPSSADRLAAILRRIHFKLSRAQESDWKPESQVTQAQLDEANLLLSQIITRLNPVKNPQVNARLASFEKQFFADLVDKWELLQTNVNSRPPRVADLPLTVRQRFVSPQGTSLIRIFPAQDVWNLEPLSRFVQDLRKVDPNVVGDPVLLYVFTSAFRNACLWAVGMALLLVTLVLFIFFRDLKLALLAMMPLFIGTGWTLNLMWLLDIPFNQANVLFLPLILGEGIEYGIIVLTRWKMDAQARSITLPASTAKGVALAALTTTVGFGSLMVSGHRGVFSLGLLATVGSLCVMLAVFTVLPALLRLLENRERRARSTHESMLPMGALNLPSPKKREP